MQQNESVCDFVGLKYEKFHHKCNTCKKGWLTSLSGLMKKFPNTHKFWINYIEKFILLLRKDVNPYEYMNSWERFDKKSLLGKKTLYSELNLQDITDEDYIHAEKVF